MKRASILIVEDNMEINNLLKAILAEDHYETVSAYSGTEALLHMKHSHFDMILLDLMLPGMSGEETLKVIRQDKQIPIIIISAKSETKLKAQLLRIGADDYITKPFDNEEVLARIATNLRRSNLQENRACEEIRFKDIVLDTQAKSVAVNQQKLTLTSKEYSILELMLSNKNKIFSKANLFESIWHEEYVYEDNTINVHMSNVRNKLKKANSNEEYIETIWGMGYKLADD